MPGRWNIEQVTDPGQLPGFYVNFTAEAAAALAAGEYGVVAIPVTAVWGPLDQTVVIKSQADIDRVFSLTEDGTTARFALSECLKGGPSKVLARRIATSAAAKASITLQDTDAVPANVMTLTALYEGTRGNLFKVTVRDDPADATKQQILLYEGSVLLRTFTWAKTAGVDGAVAAVNGDSENVYVVAAKLAVGTGLLKAVSGQVLSGGDNGATVVVADYTEAMTALEAESFDVFCFDAVSDAAIVAAGRTWANELRGQGRMVTFVYGLAAGALVSDAVAAAALSNHEGHVVVYPGVKIGDTVYSSAQIAPRVAGAVAGYGPKRGLTYLPLEGYDGVEKALTYAEKQSLQRGGVLYLWHDGTFVRTGLGINTLTVYTTDSYGNTKNELWSKIRVMRSLDWLNNAVVGAAEKAYIGNLPNDPDGRATLLAGIRGLVDTAVAARMFQRDPAPTVALDERYPPTRDRVFVKVGVTPVDSVDRVYLTVVVSG